MTKQNVHNNFFQHFFSHAEVVADCMRWMLPKELVAVLDFTTLQRKKTDFLPSRYRNSRHADALWLVDSKSGKILLHIEHQSRPDRLMAARTLEYQAAIIRSWMVSEQGEVPPIISIVIYHGKTSWTGPKSIAEAFSAPELHIQEGFYKPFLRDLTQYRLQELEKHGEGALPELILAARRSRDMCGITETVAPLIRKCKNCCREAAINYMATLDKQGAMVFLEELSKFDEETAEKYKPMFESAIQETQKRFLTLGIEQGIEQGIEKGIEQGIEQGIEKGIEKGMEQGIEKGEKKRNIEIAKAMLRDGKSLEEIQKYTGVTKQWLGRLKNEINAENRL